MIPFQQQRTFYLKLLSDTILSKFPDGEKSLIKFVDVGNFVIIKGKTTSTEVLDLFKITSEFEKKFGHHFDNIKINTIDIIEYNTQIDNINLKTSTNFKI